MLNLYGNLTDLKAILNIVSSPADSVIMEQLKAATKDIEEYCHRRFYSWLATMYYDGKAYILPDIDDLLSVTSFHLDMGDGTFPITLITTEPPDYFLYPLADSYFPKRMVRANPFGRYTGFSGGIRRSVKITGLWGYGTGYTATPWSPCGVTATVGATGAAVTVSADGIIKPGHTIYVDSEFMFVQSVATGSITVVRGVNGSTAAAHSGAAVSICEYPGDIQQTCYKLAARYLAQIGKIGFISERISDYSYQMKHDNTDILTELDPYIRTSGWVV